MRIEDTDRQRSTKEFERDIIDSLEWLGIVPDEGPREGGPYAPYRQSERLLSYQNYLKKLLESGQAFYCGHSDSELEKEQELLRAEKKPPVHFCAHRELDSKEGENLAKAKKSFVIRFKCPREREIKINDLIRGDIVFNSSVIGDFSIAKNLDELPDHPAARRPDGRATGEISPLRFSPLYNFAVVIDDAEMRISHVIRGEDHISNTPKQVLIQEALGFPQLHFAHLPIILGSDRAKLSKRHGATAVSQFRREGYLAEALINFMALLGWNPGGDRAVLEKGEPRPKEREIFSMDELIKEFDLDKVQKSGAVFNLEKLDWLNGEYVRSKPLSELTDLVMPFLEKSGLLQIPNSKFQIPKEYIEKVLKLEQPRLKKLSEIGDRVDYFFREPEYDPDLLKWKTMDPVGIKASLGKSLNIVQSIDAPFNQAELERKFLEEIGAGDKGFLLWPLRVALSGKKASPGPFEIMKIIEKEKAISRIKAAIQKIGKAGKLN